MSSPDPLVEWAEGFFRLIDQQELKWPLRQGPRWETFVDDFRWICLHDPYLAQILELRARANHSAIITRTGHVLTDEECERLATEAERGYDISALAEQLAKPDNATERERGSADD